MADHLWLVSGAGPADRRGATAMLVRQRWFADRF
jgi:hypothetical protein